LWGAVKGVASGGLDALTAGLQALDTPRAAVTSAIKETRDLLTEGESASLADLTDQMFGETIRFSDAFPEADKVPTGVGQWITNFAGEVITDPLSYLGAPGAAGMARSVSSKKLARILAAEKVEGTLIPAAAHRYALARGDDAARRYDESLQKVLHRQRTPHQIQGRGAKKLEAKFLAESKEYGRWLIDEGYEDHVSEAIVKLASRGGGAGSIKDDLLVDVLLRSGDGPLGASGLRLRPFWSGKSTFLGHRTIQVLNQAQWAAVSRPFRAVTGSIAGSRAGKWTSAKLGMEANTAAHNLLENLSDLSMPSKVGLLHFTNETTRIFRETGVWGEKQHQAIRNMRIASGGDVEKHKALRDLITSGYVKDWGVDPLNPEKLAPRLDNLSDIADPNTRAHMERIVAALGGKDEALNMAAPVVMMLERVQQTAKQHGIDIQDVHNYFPTPLDREAVEMLAAQGKRGAHADYSPLSQRKLPASVQGERIPYVDELLNNPRAADAGFSVQDGKLVIGGYTDFDYTRYSRELTETGIRSTGEEDWVNLLIEDPAIALEKYINNISAQINRKKAEQVLLDSGVGHLTSVWKAVEDGIRGLDGIKAGMEGAELASKIAARAADTAVETEKARAANDTIWALADHTPLVELHNLGLPKTVQHAMENLYAAEYYGALLPDAYRPAMDGAIDDLLFNPKATDYATQPKAQTGAAQKLARDQLWEAIDKSKLTKKQIGRLEKLFPAVKKTPAENAADLMAGLEKLRADGTSNAQGYARNPLSPDKSQALDAALNTIEKLEREIDRALAGTQPAGVQDRLQELKARMGRGSGSN